MTMSGIQSVAPPLPVPRGELSSALVTALRGEPGTALPPSAAATDPMGADAQLALHTCYELHYQGFAGVHPEWEWDLAVLRLRAGLERAFTDWLRAHTSAGGDPVALLTEMTIDHHEGQGISYFLRDEADWQQVREYFAHRSIYHLKEADPHAWVIPRLHGRAKAGFVAVEFDEYGGGRAERMHQRLYADLLSAAGLDNSYLGYADHVPAQTFATVNLLSLCGLHRSLRGAMAGSFAAAEIATAPSARRTAQGLQRLGAPPACVHFYTEHMEADAVHEQVLRQEVVGGLLAAEPELAPDMVFGIQAAEVVQERLGQWLREHWAGGVSSLLRPL